MRRGGWACIRHVPQHMHRQPPNPQGRPPASKGVRACGSATWPGWRRAGAGAGEGNTYRRTRRRYLIHSGQIVVSVVCVVYPMDAEQKAPTEMMLYSPPESHQRPLEDGRAPWLGGRAGGTACTYGLHSEGAKKLALYWRQAGERGRSGSSQQQAPPAHCLRRAAAPATPSVDSGVGCLPCPTTTSFRIGSTTTPSSHHRSR